MKPACRALVSALVTLALGCASGPDRETEERGAFGPPWAATPAPRAVRGAPPHAPATPAARAANVPALPAPAPVAAGRAARPVVGPDDPFVKVLGQALASKDPATRILALEAIGEARLEGLVSQLNLALGDPEHDVRMAAVEALCTIASPDARTLVATVRDDGSEALDVRALAAAALLGGCGR